MRLVLISDTHYVSNIPVPDGDVLVHAGDFTWKGREQEIKEFDRWMGGLPHANKLVVAGNHDILFETNPKRARALLTKVTYLQDEGIEIGGLSFWFSPWSPTFGAGWAFNANRGAVIRSKWDMIPSGTDVLVTHGPPFGYGDETIYHQRVGCEDLLEQVQKRIRPKLVVSGHIHEDPGTRFDTGGIQYVNASICDIGYNHSNPAVVVDL